jgi:K+/H+ antiporter YhaU regulatory subunit KhtT
MRAQLKRLSRTRSAEYALDVLSKERIEKESYKNIEFIILSQKRKIVFCFLSQKETAISGQLQLQREEAMASGSP